MTILPIGIIVNILSVILGGIVGTAMGEKMSEEFKNHLNTVFGASALTMGIYSIVLMENMPAVILSVIVGTVIGLLFGLGNKIQKCGEFLEKGISKIVPTKREKDYTYSSTMITAIVLFCASGTGIYGSIVSGMTGDHSILLAKSILDFPTAMVFACVLGAVTCVIAIPQGIIFLALFCLAGYILPLCSETMIGDFKACGGVLLLGTGFRMLKLKEFPIADMIPSMILVMPISYVWTTYVMELVS